MSFLKPKGIIEIGDTVIIYFNGNSMYAIDVTPNIVNKKGVTIEYIFQTSFGALKVKDLIGISYGSRIQLSRGWAYVLQVNPELWTLTLPHRTQIIYTPDISMILFQLEVHPGSVVVESGTGSASMAHYFIRAIKPFGHLHTFDFHAERVKQAQEEFSKHGLENFVTVYHRDVCQFGFPEELNRRADAVFLDLPSPHLAIKHVLKTLKQDGGRFCSFSPCIEQSQRICNSLQEHGFTEIQSMEILQQENIVKIKSISLMKLDFLREKRTENQFQEETQLDTKIAIPKIEKEEKKIITSQKAYFHSGHTGYLTFGTLYNIKT